MKTKEITKALNNAICKNHSGKMSGIWSLSTSPYNPICEARAKDPESICAECFARMLANLRTTLAQKLLRNTELLSREVYPVELMPRLNQLVFRLESFGDLTNTNQVKNYFNLCYANPMTTFALWTKNPNFIEDIIKEGWKKPSNLIAIYSSPFKNAKATNIKERYNFIDKVFTVYTKDYIKENDVQINCGARDCLGCLNCYKFNGINEISEILK